MNGVHQAREHLRFRDRCMRKEGWAKLTLTAEEEAAYGKTSGDARRTWTDDFLKTDIAARVEAGLKPKSDKLPTAAMVEPAAGAVRFDPAVLVAAEGPVSRGQALLTGKVSHRRTATLHDDVVIPFALGSLKALKGAVFQQVELRPADMAGADERSSMWCGRVHTAIAGTVPQCFWSDFDGYHEGTFTAAFITYPGYEDWLVSEPTFQSAAVRAIPGPIALDISDTDLIGPLDFALKLDRIDKTSLRLSAVASKDGKDARFWNGIVPLDTSGRAVLPMWSHHLVMAVQGDKVAVAFTPDGDGTGLLDLDAASGKVVASR